MGEDMKICIWGHKIYKTRHTNTFVFYGFHKAFKELGHEVIWLDNDDDISNLVFNDYIFLTEGQVDHKIPLNKNCYYITHNCNKEKYFNYKNINIQIFHNKIKDLKLIKEYFPGWDGTAYHSSFFTDFSLNKINDYTYYTSDTLYQPWATDLLPREIKPENAKNELNNKICTWIGSYGDGTHKDEIDYEIFFNKCRKNNIKILIKNPWVNPVTPDENMQLINNSFLAPAIQSPWQLGHGYFPNCRLLKNISYGHIGITNNYDVNNLFDNTLIYSKDTDKLFEMCIEEKANNKIIEKIQYQMNTVKNNHTFINRIQNIFNCLGLK